MKKIDGTDNQESNIDIFNFLYIIKNQSVLIKALIGLYQPSRPTKVKTADTYIRFA